MLVRKATTSAKSPGATRMSEQLIALLRDRVASRYYDRPEVVDAVARAIIASGGIGRSA